MFPAIVQMWPTGEGAGQAIAEVLAGRVNPSGKLSETFPTRMRSDLDLNGNGLVLEYNEKWRVGYRYYDLHPEQIWFPFGLTNTGAMDGAEVVQVYIGNPVSTASKPVKELRQFDKVFLRAGETRRVIFQLTEEDMSYYNVMLHRWTMENGVYDVYVCASARDIRLKVSLAYDNSGCYSMQRLQESMIA